MLKINDRQWKEFKIKDIFNISGSKTTPKNVLQNSGQGLYPFVTTQTTNNGQEGYYSIFTEKGNCITVDSAVCGFSTFQKNNFSASDHVEILRLNENLNLYNGLFLTMILNKNNQNKFSYGFKASQKRLSTSKIFLPVRQDDPSSPDYDFMTDFIRERMDAKRQVYVDYCLDKLRRLESDLDDVLATECDDNLGCDDMTCEGAGDRVWKEFKIKDLFKYTRGKRQVKESRTPGNIPYYSASEINNGLTDYISNPAFVINEEAICCSTFGDAYYVKPNFTTSDEVTILISPNINEFTGLFIAQAIKNNKEKYSFGRKAFSNKILNDSIILPCDKNSVPDWKYMEQQIKSLKLKKINEYLAHVKKYAGRGIKLTY